MDDQFVSTLEDEHHCLQQACVGVEAETQLAPRLFVVQRLDPQRPLGGLNGIVGRHAVLERTAEWTFTRRSGLARL